MIPVIGEHPDAPRRDAEARQFLRTQLIGQTMTSEELRLASSMTTIYWRSVLRARRQLGIVVRRGVWSMPDSMRVEILPQLALASRTRIMTLRRQLRQERARHRQYAELGKRWKVRIPKID